MPHSPRGPERTAPNEPHVTAQNTSSAPGPAPVAEANERRHVVVLDGVRGLAILLVMLYHMTLLEPGEGAWRVAHAVVSVGWCGVDLFFVLSGFLITGILLDTRGRKGYFKSFFARRALRILPLYYAVVIFSLLVLPAAGSALAGWGGSTGQLIQSKLDRFGRIEGDEWLYWLHLSNFAIAEAERFRHAILDISWSLAIEEQFYLVWPFVVHWCSRRWLVRVCLACVVVAIVFRSSLVWSGAHPIVVYVLTPGRIDGLAMGALLAIAARTPGGLAAWRRVAIGTFVVSGLTLASIGVARFITRTGPEGLEGLPSANLPEMQTVGYSIVALFFASGLALLLIAEQRQREGGRPGVLSDWGLRILSARLLQVFGLYSYAMYLFHLPIRALVRDLLLPVSSFDRFGGAIGGQAVFYVVSIGLTLGAAWISWHVLEKRALACKRYFVCGSEPKRVSGRSG